LTFAECAEDRRVITEEPQAKITGTIEGEVDQEEGAWGFKAASEAPHYRKDGQVP